MSAIGQVVYRIEREGADRLLVLLHGWSAEQHHLAAYVPLIDPGERFTAVSPRAPHPVEGTDGASWYERTPDGPVAESFLAAVELVDGLIGDECAAMGITRDRCVVGGFSQGGFLALAVAARRDAPRYGGVWAMCCGLPEVDGLELDLTAGAGTPALIMVGERDAIITPDRGRAAAAALDEAGWIVELRGYDMAHSQTIEMMVDARAWLALRAD